MYRVSGLCSCSNDNVPVLCSMKQCFGKGWAKPWTSVVGIRTCSCVDVMYAKLHFDLLIAEHYVAV